MSPCKVLGTHAIPWYHIDIILMPGSMAWALTSCMETTANYPRCSCFSVRCRRLMRVIFVNWPVYEIYNFIYKCMSNCCIIQNHCDFTKNFFAFSFQNSSDNPRSSRVLDLINNFQNAQLGVTNWKIVSTGYWKTKGAACYKQHISSTACLLKKTKGLFTIPV